DFTDALGELADQGGIEFLALADGVGVVRQVEERIERYDLLRLENAVHFLGDLIVGVGVRGFRAASEKFDESILRLSGGARFGWRSSQQQFDSITGRIEEFAVRFDSSKAGGNPG